MGDTLVDWKDVVFVDLDKMISISGERTNTTGKKYEIKMDLWAG